MKILEVLLAEPLLLHEPAFTVCLERYSPLLSSVAALRSAPTLTEQRVSTDKQLGIADFVNQRRPYTLDAENGIAVIHANDVLARGLTNVDKLLGATDYNDLIDELGQACDDLAVKGVFLDVNSPGGSAIGAPEAAAAVAALAQCKPVVAYVETVGASAAYYLASAAQCIVASPSAIVGSIGTIATFVNIAGLLSRFGVQVNLITGGDLKAAGTPFREMTRQERDFLESRVAEMTTAFREWVGSSRQSVTLDTMQGQWFSGRTAQSLGLVDQVGDRRDALAALRALVAYR